MIRDMVDDWKSSSSKDAVQEPQDFKPEVLEPAILEPAAKCKQGA